MNTADVYQNMQKVVEVVEWLQIYHNFGGLVVAAERHLPVVNGLVGGCLILHACHPES